MSRREELLSELRGLLRHKHSVRVRLGTDGEGRARITSALRAELRLRRQIIELGCPLHPEGGCRCPLNPPVPAAATLDEGPAR
jgi:hypothetical protein